MGRKFANPLNKLCSFCRESETSTMAGWVGSASGTGGYSSTGNAGSCCDGVVDPMSLLTTIAAIAAVSFFLRQAVIDFDIMMARKRRSLAFSTVVKSGKGLQCVPIFMHHLLSGNVSFSGTRNSLA